MKTASVRQLRNEFSKVAEWLHLGETVRITHNGKPFARLTPESSAAAKKKFPAHLSRLRKIFGRKQISRSAILNSLESNKRDH